jgi:hypothetical protein
MVESDHSSCTDREAVKIYVTAVRRSTGKRKHRMKLSLRPKLVENLVWVPCWTWLLQHRFIIQPSTAITSKETWLLCSFLMICIGVQV